MAEIAVGVMVVTMVVLMIWLCMAAHRKEEADVATGPRFYTRE
ncbi:hypothetical protein [Geomesophilobacter sediminis]|nr:hypothetical protein [Geomesophilobacter sediminis]